ncbi:cysteine protease StiP domain-containing protein [Thiofilum flexile]|uniref:cysteine protease StiP domain-containing protein n=1 Tax=Thiofilum flexile TaxID=125627 RepID=UPI00037FB4D6|nr:cysteine protease StiP domain-containing protein [Thiofilum flexile]
MMPTPLHGSYVPEDVTFLLRLTQMDSTEVEEKERLIQSGKKHYSQMISVEKPPSPEHQTLFEHALAEGALRLATEVQTLALALKQRRPNRPIVLVSFVRAGIPLGVLLVRALRDLGIDSTHYGISIIRDKGIDIAALNTIRAQHDFDDLVYVDGWVGKGAIHSELERSLQHFYPHTPIPFVVLADPTGKAWLAASGEDWLIPFSILGATVSGLISRSILSTDGDWHQCLYYQHLEPYDRTQYLIETVDAVRKTLGTNLTLHWPDTLRADLHTQSQNTLRFIQTQYTITNLNRIKTGIAEATRAVLRRVPERILVQTPDDPHLQILKHLAKNYTIPFEVLGQDIAPYRAITIIKKAI